MPVNRDLNASMEGDTTTSAGMLPNPNSSMEETVAEGQLEYGSYNCVLSYSECLESDTVMPVFRSVH